jgi:hypothetical protein
VNLNSFVTGMVAGAGIAFALDPVSGGRRRALVRDQVIRAGHKTRDAADVAIRDLSNRTRGIAAATRSRFGGRPVDGRRLVERVRATLGRVSSHPRAIDVLDTEAGEVTLRGAVLAAEADRIVAAAGSVPGVNGVVDLLDRHESSDDVPALQGGGRLPTPRLDILQRRWSPATRTLLGAAAVAAAAVSMSQLRGHGYRPRA